MEIDMEKRIMDSVAKLDEIFPDRPPFMNVVEVIHPEMAKYAEMHITSRITNKQQCKQIPWEEIYNIVKNKKTTDSRYKQVQKAIWKFNEHEHYVMEVVKKEYEMDAAKKEIT